MGMCANEETNPRDSVSKMLMFRPPEDQYDASNTGKA